MISIISDISNDDSKMFKMWSLEYGEVLWENLEEKTGGLGDTGCIALVVFDISPSSIIDDPYH